VTATGNSEGERRRIKDSKATKSPKSTKSAKSTKSSTATVGCPTPPVETPDGWSKVANGEAAYEALDGDDVKVVVGATQVVDIGFDYNWFEETFTEVCISRGLALINMGGTSCDNSNDAGKRIALVGRFTPADGSAIVY